LKDIDKRYPAEISHQQALPATARDGEDGHRNRNQEPFVLDRNYAGTKNIGGNFPFSRNIDLLNGTG